MKTRKQGLWPLEWVYWGLWGLITENYIISFYEIDPDLEIFGRMKSYSSSGITDSGFGFSFNYWIAYVLSEFCRGWKCNFETWRKELLERVRVGYWPSLRDCFSFLLLRRLWERLVLVSQALFLFISLLLFIILYIYFEWLKGWSLLHLGLF